MRALMAARGGAIGWCAKGGPARLRVPALLGALAVACSPALDWREVRPAGSTVVALMPCKPNISTRVVPLAGQPVHLSMLTCKADGLVWALMTADVGDPRRVGTVLTAMRDSVLDNLQGRVERSAPAAVRGATPNEAQVRVQVAGRKPDGTPVSGQFVVFSRGTRVFQATVLGAQVPDAAAATFLDSLRAGS